VINWKIHVGNMLIKVGAKITLTNKTTWEPNENNNEE
jgi:hypothetical protein